MTDILIIEDNISQAKTYEAILNDTLLYHCEITHNGKNGQNHAAQRKFDVILLDINLPDANGLDILKIFHQKYPHTPVIIMTAEASVTAVDAKRLGAFDFVPKPVKKERLLISVENALENKRLKKIEKQFQNISRNHFCDFIGMSTQMQSIYRTIENASKTNAPVLITGESGTGKELAARAIHQLGQRYDNPFIALNCGAIPETLMESEIFGHVKGAFTGATQDRDGAATLADQGSLFLDELIEMPLNMQVKMLRFIQAGTFSKVGDTQEISVDVRFICATNKNPLQSIENKTFREDLFYRLNVVSIDMPPLRQRGEDIILLAEYFLSQSSTFEKKSFQKIDKDAKAKLLSYHWPGNVRELENMIRRIVIMNDSDVLTLDMLVDFQEKNNGLTSRSQNHSFFKTKSDINTLNYYERDIIQKAIQICDGNITEAARYLNINPTTIHRKRKSWSKD